MKIIVAISGSSGSKLGLSVLEKLPESVEKHLIVTDHADIVLDKEHSITVHNDNEIWASVASEIGRAHV